MAEDRSRVGADEFDEQPGLSGAVEGREAPAQGVVVGRRLRGRGRPARRCAHQAAQQRRQSALRRRGPQGRGVEAHRDQGGPVHGEGGVEERESPLGGERRHPGPGEASYVVLVQVSGEGAGLLPQGPGQGLAGQARRPTLDGQGVEEGVGGGVVGLSGAAEGARGRGEEHEVRQVEVAGQFVQVEGGVDLGAQHGVHPFGGECGDDAVVEGARGMDHGGQRVRGRQVREYGGQGDPVGGIAGDDGGLGSQRGEFGPQFVGSGGGRAAAGEQEQVPDAVPGDQAAGDVGAEQAGAAGDEDRAVRVEGPEGPCRVVREVRVVPEDPGQPGYADVVAADRGLRFSRGEGRGDACGGAVLVVGVEVEQGEAPGVFGPGRTDQAPECAVRGVAYVLPLPGADRTPGGEHQARAGEAVVGEPGPDVAEGLVDDRADHRGRSGRVRGLRAGEQDRFGHRSSGVDGGQQRGQVRGAVNGCTAAARGCGDPLRRIEVLVAAAVGGAVGAEADGARGPQDQCVHGRHGGAGRVGDGERHRVGPGRGEPDADRAGAGGVQGHAVPGERQPSLGVGLRAGGAGHTGGVQGRVQQGRVQAEAGGIGCGPSGHDGLREQLVTAPPHRVQALEGGTVGESARREAVVQSVEGEGFGAGRRPGHRPVGLGAFRAVLGQDAFGVPGPLVAVGVTVDGCVRPGVQAERAVAQGVGGAHGEAQHGAAVFGQHQGGLEGEFLDPGAADAGSGLEREFQEGGAREQCPAADGVVGEPRVGAGRQAAGEEQAVAVREDHDGAQQRMARGGQSGRGDVADGRGAFLQPVLVALEGVGGQFHPSGAAVGEDGVPVRGDSAQVEFGQGLGEPARAPSSRRSVPTAVASAPASSAVSRTPTVRTGCGLLSRRTW